MYANMKLSGHRENARRSCTKVTRLISCTCIKLSCFQSWLRITTKAVMGWPDLTDWPNEYRTLIRMTLNDLERTVKVTADLREFLLVNAW